MTKNALLRRGFWICIVALAAFSAPASATNLVVNGSFETITSNPEGTSFKIDDPSTEVLSGWSATPNSNGNNILACLVLNGAESVMCGAAPSGGIGDNLSLDAYATCTGCTSGRSQDGGNYILADADSTYSLAFSQTLTSTLTVGQHYTLSFYQAGAEEHGFGTSGGGTLQETWDVTIGGQALQGTTLSVPQTTATAWTLDTINFTYSGTSGAGQVLQFLATSNQNGAALPPFLLLDGVSLQVMTPEPATVSYLLMAGLSFCLVRKRLGKRS